MAKRLVSRCSVLIDCTFKRPNTCLLDRALLSELTVLLPPQMLAVAALGAAAGLWGLRRSRQAHGLYARPPAMETDDSAAEDGSSGNATSTSVAAPTDAYTALKQNYDGVMAFAGTVQNVLDGWATGGERVQALLSWQDPVASAVLVGVLVLSGVGLWLVGLRVLLTFGMLWTVRPPALRDPYPPPPNNFLLRLPTRGDTLM